MKRAVFIVHVDLESDSGSTYAPKEIENIFALALDVALPNHKTKIKLIPGSLQIVDEGSKQE
jgi:hypothetical protein